MIIHNDCIKAMAEMGANSVDAIVCDPPYGLEFMGKEWDKLWDSRNKDDQSNEGIKTFLRAGKNLTAYKAGIEAQLWHTQWLTEAYRVLKPGGSMLVMGGTRTFHRLMVAIEDSGFVIKDTLMWLYGSGFPKAQDLGKMIDKRMGAERNPITKEVEIKDLFRDEKAEVAIKKPWDNSAHHFIPGENHKERIQLNITNPLSALAKHWDGFKVGGIKPAFEPIVWAVKPPEGSYIDNVLKYGVGAVNVDECRVATNGKIPFGSATPPYADSRTWNTSKTPGIERESHVKGRFPANVLLSCYCDNNYLTGNNLFGIIKDALKEVKKCLSKNSFLSVNNVVNQKFPESTSKETKSLFSVAENVSTNILEKILGKLLVDISKMDIGCSVGILTENINTNLSMFISGKKQMEKYQDIMKFIISMAKKMIIDWKISSVYQRQSIEVFITKITNGIQKKGQVKFHNPDCPIRLLDEMSGVSKSSGGEGRYPPGMFGATRTGEHFGDSGGASRFYYCAKSSRSERNAGLDNSVSIDIIKVWKEKNITKQESLVRLLVDMDTLPIKVIDVSGTKNKSVSEWSMSWFGKSIMEKYQKESGLIIKTATSSIMISQILKYLTGLFTKGYIRDVKLSKENGGNPVENADNSSQLIITISELLASRLGVKGVASKMQLKISVKEGRNVHPTCKPISLFKHLISLVTRKGQIVLDPFMGSGTTGCACAEVEREFIGIEKEGKYIEIAKKRIKYWESKEKQKELFS